MTNVQTLSSFSGLLSEPLDAVVFDCDSTLTSLEGIDVLAEWNQVRTVVHTLTDQAMSDTGMTESLYSKRLDLVAPTQQQVLTLGRVYSESLVEDAFSVVELLHNLGKPVFIVSAGLQQSLLVLAKKLQIPPECVFGVEVFFHADGQYRDFDHTSPMVFRDGKRQIIEFLQSRYPLLAHIGDGMNDVAAAGVVERFIGFGGITFRQSVADLSDYYVRSPSLASVLPLLLTEQEVQLLQETHKALFDQGMQAVVSGEVLINAEAGLQTMVCKNKMRRGQHEA